eukprot:Mycagemm_TRINITY_DN3956_c0_g1::TRINITY_DN3956_c0_g1_i1::g.1444::m.1444 type:complete len:130 gc:universal TRINITY_DN3956_c0_g1_i1:940-551(-)
MKWHTSVVVSTPDSLPVSSCTNSRCTWCCSINRAASSRRVLGLQVMRSFTRSFFVRCKYCAIESFKLSAMCAASRTRRSDTEKFPTSSPDSSEMPMPEKRCLAQISKAAATVALLLTVTRALCIKPLTT